ncbi:ribonuclease domain-containing protein [Caballeronia ptereochthonis]|uniref:ribonuclease domain-containing protein n=1 Tax=Caballeronia ptereochthonis TaxID=1777144 RepID=UPI000A4FB3F6|nr:ribonuclease domain-containing protein [Caballeronia ptereochthonis]
MKRAWVLSCILGLSVVLSGCGKEEPPSRTQAPVQSAEAVQQAQAGQPAATGGQTADGLPAVQIAQLPRQAVATLRLIEAGGPFPYEKDGVVFGNRERLLPRRPRGYYHEYTVSTPRSRDRGARRIICGGPKRQIDDCYYTDDHYASFKRIADQPRD